MGHVNEIYLMRQDYLTRNWEYTYCHHSEFKYEILQNITYLYRSGNSKKKVSYNNCIIMADTETSRNTIKKSKNVTRLPSGYTARDNHVCAWTISIRAFELNICTLWGHKPSTFCDTLAEIIKQLDGDITLVYFHNMAYDYTFLRRFMFKKFGKPIKALNIKPHYPLFLRFANGLEIRDSLILAQKSLDMWAKDLKVPHQKAVGKWNYKKYRSQKAKYNKNELEYIEHDTLAGVECLNATMNSLKKNVFSMPYTSTGIIRYDIRKIGLDNGANDLFKLIAPTYEQYIKLTKLFHGGYVHANRFYIDTLITELEHGLVECYDFASSYPFCMLVFKYPMERFTPIPDMKLSEIAEKGKNTAYMFKWIGYKVKLRNPNISNPSLQFSKCVKNTCINPVLDNGRILECDYLEIYMNEIDAEVIVKQYTAQKSVCVEVEAAYKDYLPRWFTDYVFGLFKAKCELKYEENREVDYAISKTRVNGCFGLTSQKSLAEEIIEDYETTDCTEAYKSQYADLEEKEREVMERKDYEKYLKRKNNVLPYFWGCWITSYAFRNLFTLSECVLPEDQGGLLLYNDTDSGYAIGWDKDKIKAYNDKCLELLRANGYDSVNIKGHTFTLGVAEHEGLKDEYSEFKVMGAKRYAGRCKKDNEIHITVAGVPKHTGAACLNNDLNNFTDGFKFDGRKTGKLMHTYFYNDIWEDQDGNESADSIDLSPCSYKLDSTDKYDYDYLFSEEIEMESLFYEYF